MNEKVLDQIKVIKKMYDEGLLGDTRLPEDANPGLDSSSEENALYFTLPTALNYRRNSFTLWENALKTYNDEQTKFVFSPEIVVEKSYTEIQTALTKYQLAIQRNKQTEIWLKICQTLNEHFNNSVLTLFKQFDNDVEQVRHYLQRDNKPDFPYLSGKKLCNYWLYVIANYTDINLKKIDQIAIAADTHVIKASVKLGLISSKQEKSSRVQDEVIKAWSELLKGTEYCPADFQNPVWFWGREGCPALITKGR